MTATATARPVWTGDLDTWTMSTLREAKAFRDANPDPEHAAADAYLDALLESAEAAAAALGTTRSVPVADEPARPQGTGHGTGAARNAATGSQLSFIASLSAKLGYELQTPRDKAHASLIIDGAKKALAAQPAAARPARKATERQVEYVTDLLLNRAHNHPLDMDVEALSFDQASALITELADAPRVKVAAHGITEGRYAYSTDGGATADHYRVRRDGKIVVWTAGGEWPYNGKLNDGLEWIKAHQREAAALFGQLVGCCGRCGRDLSDDDSRARGLGPVCASKGW